MFALGTLINVAAIILGGALGLLIQRDLPVARQNQLRTLVGMGVILTGFQMIWTGLHAMILGAAFVLVLLALLATTLGNWLGRLLKVQAGMNRLGRHAGEVFARAQRNQKSISFNDGFQACAVLFCVGPLSVLGPMQEGLGSPPWVLGVKAAMDGLAAFAFARVFGASVIASAFPVLAMQGTITLLTRWAAKSAVEPAILPSIHITGGLLVVCAVLLVFEVRKVPIGDFLPAVLIAPLLAWFFL